MSQPRLYVVRNEVDADYEYHCDALASAFPEAEEVDFPAGERPDLDEADGVVLSGSTTGVYEADERPWIADQEVLVRELVDSEVPTLGVCFGHQVVNSALGGTVENVGLTAGLVEADLADDPLFAGVSPIVQAIHGDVVTENGDDTTVIAATEHAPVFGTRHRSAPLWTVQFHPELTEGHRDVLEEDFDWKEGAFSFADVSTEALFENFRELVAQRTSG